MRKRQNELKKIEDSISNLEEQLSSIDEELSLPDTGTNLQRLLELDEKKQNIQKELDILYAQWEELAE